MSLALSLSLSFSLFSSLSHKQIANMCSQDETCCIRNISAALSQPFAPSGFTHLSLAASASLVYASFQFWPTAICPYSLMAAPSLLLSCYVVVGLADCSVNQCVKCGLCTACAATVLKKITIDSILINAYSLGEGCLVKVSCNYHQPLGHLGYKYTASGFWASVRSRHVLSAGLLLLEPPHATGYLREPVLPWDGSDVLKSA